MNTNTRLKQTRIARDLSQDELAEIVGCNQSWIAHLETGGKRPSRAVARRVAAALGTDAPALFGQDIERRRKLR